jgi:hypothetical protein
MTDKSKIDTTGLVVSSFDNRGTEDHPFGFVYFTDGARIAYGAYVVAGSGGWGETTPAHVVAAVAHLNANGLDIEADPELDL